MRERERHGSYSKKINSNSLLHEKSEGEFYMKGVLADFATTLNKEFFFEFPWSSVEQKKFYARTQEPNILHPSMQLKDDGYHVCNFRLLLSNMSLYCVSQLPPGILLYFGPEFGRI